MKHFLFFLIMLPCIALAQCEEEPVTTIGIYHSYQQGVRFGAGAEMIHWTEHWAYGAGVYHHALYPSGKRKDSVNSALYGKIMYKVYPQVWAVVTTELLDATYFNTYAGVRWVFALSQRVGIGQDVMYSPVIKRLNVNTMIMVNF